MNRKPEPSGEEGLQDVRIVQALYKSAATGKAVAIPPFADGKRPSATPTHTGSPIPSHSWSEIHPVCANGMKANAKYAATHGKM